MTESAAASPTGRPQGEPEKAQDNDMQAAKTVLLAAIHLIEKRGFGRMALLPYISPSGMYWRCELHPVGHPSRTLFRYTTGDGHRCVFH